MNPFDANKIRTYPIAERESKTSVDDVVRGSPIKLDSEQASAVLQLGAAIHAARTFGAPVAIGMGAHLIKMGLGRILASLITKKCITSVAMNGAAAFHDMELALFGKTSEDVDEALTKGKFGFALEPVEFYCGCAAEAAAKGRGLGEMLGLIAHDAGWYVDDSVLVACVRNDIPITVHVSIGCDVVHMHPCCDGAALGQSSMYDFRKFCAVVMGLKDGVYINIGSAVVMPEVFLKAASVAFNQDADLSGLTTANMDRLDHYRPRTNVLNRIPGRSIDVRGDFRTTIPMLGEILRREPTWISSGKLSASRRS